MHIKSIELTNVRSYKNLNIDLSPQINIIIGANNSGKSTILKTIFHLQNKGDLGAKDVRKPLEYGLVSILLDDVKETDHKKFKNYQDEDIRNNASKNWIFTEPSHKIIYTLGPNPKSFCLHPNDNYNIVQSDSWISFDSFSNREDEHSVFYTFLSERKKGTYYHSQYDSKAVFEVSPDFHNLSAKIKKLISSNHRKDDFKKACLDILNVEIGIVPGDNNQDKIGIYVDDVNYILVDSMGEGVYNILCLLTTLFTEDNKIFLIEEVENDLHPKALKNLLELLIKKSNSNQFIISTHSNIVLKYLGSQNSTKIFETNWSPKEDENSKKLMPTSGLLEIENSPQKRIELLERLGYDLIDYELYKGYIIFEESSAEQIIKGFIIPYLVPSLQSKVRTIASNGTGNVLNKFQSLHAFFLYAHTADVYKNRAWTITDGDATGIETKEKIKSKFPSWPSNHFLSFQEPRFENYYPKHFEEQIESIFTIEDAWQRLQEKGKLAKTVLEWSLSNIEEAKEKFSNSAKEVIAILNSISEELNK